MRIDTNIRRQEYFSFFNGEPVRVAPPKARSMAAIRKAATVAAAERTPGDKYHQAKRAFQYVMAMRGEETEHGAYLDPSRARFDKAPDGSRRVREILIDSEWVAIPHWDFTPTIEQIS